MAAKRRRSRSKGGGTIGCAPFLVLIVIAIIIKFWWVILISLGVVAVTVALVRTTKAPPRPAPIPPPKPQPVIAAPRIPVGGDDLTAHMRNQKRAGRERDLQEWDYEWIRLAHPGMSLREVNEIANAHFARGRSIGINWGEPSGP
ncbi:MULTISPECIES: hypothetical protein [unclassified Arthrobacter]|uniref:hypothetical protein n=1 Tax=unclassified Arthrobacter TaxID=235627 RepID=UPI001F45AE75|nr:hypothetical protein [Arthrobacter sp. FW306-06-A]UKA70326.1 hypothetical protein LFT49_16520 [Arthrobacter sp. FW306-06-A]